MALAKTKAIERGETVHYWRWIQQNRSDLLMQAHYVLGGWKDQAEREAFPHSPRVLHAFDWNGADYPFDIAAISEADMNDCSVAYVTAKQSVLDEEGLETNIFIDAEGC